MSVYLTFSDAVKDRLESVSELADSSVVVQRNQDLKNELDRALAKTKGALIVITWQGATFNERNLTTDANYEVKVITKPILRKDAMPTVGLVEHVIKALHKWHGDQHCLMSMYAESVSLDDDPKFLSYSITFNTKIHLL